MQRAATAYLQTQITTTSPGDLLIMLYDGAIKFLNQSKDYLAVNDMAKKGLAISKTLDVLNELESTLNVEKGGELAKNLHSLYIFCSNHLVRANLKKDPAMIDEVIKILSGLRNAYAEIASLPEAQAAAQENAAAMRPTAIMPPRAPQKTNSGTASPHPGAGLRQHNLYVRNGAQAAGPQPVDDKAQPSPAEIRPENAAAQPATAPEVPLSPPPPVNGGFINRQSGAGLYRKFSAH